MLSEIEDMVVAEGVKSGMLGKVKKPDKHVSSFTTHIVDLLKAENDQNVNAVVEAIGMLGRDLILLAHMHETSFQACMIHALSRADRQIVLDGD